MPKYTYKSANSYISFPTSNFHFTKAVHKRVIILTFEGIKFSIINQRNINENYKIKKSRQFGNRE